MRDNYVKLIRPYHLSFVFYIKSGREEGRRGFQKCSHTSRQLFEGKTFMGGALALSSFPRSVISSQPLCFENGFLDDLVVRVDGDTISSQPGRKNLKLKVEENII